MAQSWMFDAILYVYALSLSFFFSDFAGKSRRAGRIGEGLLLFVWVLQTVYLPAVFHGRVTEVFSMSGTLFFFSWLLVTVTLAVNRFMRIEMFVFLTNVIGFAVLALHVFSRTDVTPLRPEWRISDELLFIHISLSIASYTAFLISAVLSGMYLFLHRRLKKRNWTSAMKRMPSLEKLDGYTFKAVVIGAPMLLLSLCLGIDWLLVLNRTTYLTDPKVLTSLLILAAYTVYFIQRLSLRTPGNKLAVWNLVSFGIVLVNFVGSNWFAKFHQWIWM